MDNSKRTIRFQVLGRQHQIDPCGHRLRIRVRDVQRDRYRGMSLNPVLMGHASHVVVFHAVRDKNGFYFSHKEESEWKDWGFDLIKVQILFD